MSDLITTKTRVSCQKCSKSYKPYSVSQIMCEDCVIKSTKDREITRNVLIAVSRMYRKRFF